MSDVVRLETRGAVALVTIDHPPANAVSRAVIAGLREAVRAAEADTAVRAAVLTGAGPRFFAAGADITEFAALTGDDVATGQSITDALEASRLPWVAAVNGIALGGGCELALACDIRIASEGVRFGQPEINLGIIPGWGGTQRLPRLIGRSRAAAMLLTGDPIDATTALQAGLVSLVVAGEDLLPTALALAEKLATKAPLAVAATRRALAEGLDRPLAEGLEVERRAFVELFGSADAREGVAAFLEKRTPAWTGR